MAKCSNTLSGLKTSRLEHGMVLLRQEMASIACDRDELHLEQKTRMKNGEALHPEDSVRKLTKRLQDRDMYIAFLEEQIKLTRSKYELKVSDVKIGADLLEQELKKLRHELQEITSKAKDHDQLQQQMDILYSKLSRRNAIIAQYEAQHTEIMSIISQLHQCKMNRLHHQKDIGTQTVQNVKQSTNDTSDATNVHSKLDGTAAKVHKKPVQKFACLTTALRKKIELKTEA
ncbi:uncharacterized protein Dwil_GK18048 [Drosophila willistoni]|uniref:Uncharacterized protein n=1 Tax=Drosophila willistoni TaxID=7260 RepID=B4N6F3_DROWI|nr:uncharacterized protein LOC6646011 [Drosophila willistoni]EDW79942.1 uncharacterized protein Dwil_GK18048 [Drosophila willistoni]